MRRFGFVSRKMLHPCSLILVVGGWEPERRDAYVIILCPVRPFHLFNNQYVVRQEKLKKHILILHPVFERANLVIPFDIGYIAFMIKFLLS